MDDLSRSWAILNLPPGSSEEAVRSSYRELVKTWHPDRFQGDADRLDEAHEMLKEINWAYEYLGAKVFPNSPGAVEVGPPATASPAPPAVEGADQLEEVPNEKRSGKLFIWIALAAIAAAAVFYFIKPTKTKTSQQPIEPSVTTTPTVTTTPETPPPTPPATRDRNILKAMTPVNKLKIVESPDGLVLTETDSRQFLQAPRSMRPPFVFRATVKTGEADVRFFYGLGLVILNWTDNPIELRVHDFATSAVAGFKRKGALEPNVWHELVFDVQTNGLTVSVDGDVRYEGQGFYRNLNSAPGLGPSGGEITVKSIIIEEPAGADIADTGVRPRPLVPGDLLATMVPITGAQTNADLEGLIILDSERKGGAILTQQKFHPPLIIRTRAKTDGLNLRLFYGTAPLIFNWEVNPGELRVHDPANGRANAVAGKGRILPNEWHDIVWEIARPGMRVLVDGQLRFQCSGDYSKLNAPAGIGGYLSKITVASFVVEQK